MNNDIQPSVVCACFTTEKAWNNLKTEMKANNLNFRELRIIDVGIPLETEQYEKAMCFLKPFTKPILRRFVENIPFKSFVNKALGKVHLTSFDYDNFVQEDEKRSPMAFAGFTPLFVDGKYMEHYSEEEKANWKKLLSFKSDTYKPKPLKEQGIFEDSDMKVIKNKSNKDKLVTI